MTALANLGAIGPFVRRKAEDFILIAFSLLLTLGIYFVRVWTYDLNLHDYATRWGYGTFFSIVPGLFCIGVFGILAISLVIWTIHHTIRKHSLLPLLIMIAGLILALSVPRPSGIFWWE